MSKPLPNVFLVRHGETEWTLSGRHTGLTDLPSQKGARNRPVGCGIDYKV